MQIKRVSLDLAKNVIQIHAVDRTGRKVLGKALKRREVLPFFRNLPPCEVGMEACSSAHHWGRQLQAMGHQVRLLPPQYVKPFVVGQKNDANDAAAICAAMAQPGITAVPVKSVEQQDVQAQHRVRSARVAERTAQVNQIRGLLAEYGLVAPTGRLKLQGMIPKLLEDAENGLSFDFRQLLADLYADLVALNERIEQLTRSIEAHVRGHEAAQRLLKIPGIGPLSASALVTAVGDGRQFRNGRQMAAFLGLVPRQHSSGGKARLLGIHKRGDSYLRGLLVHGARSVFRAAENKPDARSRWLMSLSVRRHCNIATVAQANKNVRIAWALLARSEHYRSGPC
jgi:transposase